MQRQKARVQVALGFIIILLALGYFFASRYFDIHGGRMRGVFYLYYGLLGCYGGTILLLGIGAAVTGSGIYKLIRLKDNKQ